MIAFPKSHFKITSTRVFLPLIALAFLITACQNTVTSTPQVGRGTPTLTPAPQQTRTTAPDPLTPTPTVHRIPESNLGLSPEELDGVEVSVWHVWTGSQGMLFDQLVSDFNAANEYAVTVKPVYQGNYNELYKKVPAAIAAGEEPDIAVGYNYEILSWRGDGEVLIDLNAYVNDPTWGLGVRELDEFYPVFWDQDAVTGARLGIPAQRFGLLMYYNLTWAQELGFERPPQNPLQFERQACAAAQEKRANDDPADDGTGGWVANTSPFGVLSWIYAFGGQVVSSRGYQFDAPESAAALAFLEDLHDRGCAWEINAPFAGQEFASRQALFITASIADLPDQLAAIQQSGSQDQWAVIAFPSPKEHAVVTVYGPDFALFRSTERAQLAAWTFLKWLLSADVQARWVSGGHTFPLRTGTLEHLQAFKDDHPQWAQAVQLLPYARSEPGLESWSVVRWVVSDVGTQMFRPYFTPDRIAATVKLLDETAAELHQRIEP